MLTWYERSTWSEIHSAGCVICPLPHIKMRHLEDAHGRAWHVYERINSSFSPAAGRASLVFDTEGMVRRLWRYPAAWASLSDDALLSLMDNLTGDGVVRGD